MTDISFIIVNFNTRGLLRNCLESVFKIVAGISFEIFVVDNGSDDGSLEMLENEFPDINLLRNTRNLGFAAANNQALKIMRGRYAVLLNTDTVLLDNSVINLFNFMENNPDCAMACGQLLNADGSKQNSIAKFPDIFTLMSSMPLLEYLFPGNYPSKRYKIDNPIEIDSAIGACLIVRKQSIDEVGILDERYFFFFEETDWALQMKKAGWKVFFVPSAFIYHFQGQSIGHSISSRILFYKSRYKYFQKWKGPLYNLFVRLIVLSRLSVNWFFNLILFFLLIGTSKKVGQKFRIYSQLMLWHLRGCPSET